MKDIVLKHIVWKEGKHYVAQCLNVDVSSFGKSRPSAIQALTEALELYFEDEKKPTKLAEVDEPVVVETRLQHA